MKTFSLDRGVELCSQLFNEYVEPYAYALMSGELPAITFMVHRSGTKDGEWTATVRLKNTLTISVFRCEVWMDDIFNFCRNCKMWLITEEVFASVSLFYMLHGLLQTQYMNFETDVNTDYDSMMSGAGYGAYKFMKSHFPIHSTDGRLALELVYYKSMVLTNNYKHAPKLTRVGDLINDYWDDYEYYMLQNYYHAYKSARRQKAQTNQVDEDGFIVLERRTNGSTRYLT